MVSELSTQIQMNLLPTPLSDRIVPTSLLQVGHAAMQVAVNRLFKSNFTELIQCRRADSFSRNRSAMPLLETSSGLKMNRYKPGSWPLPLFS